MFCPEITSDFDYDENLVNVINVDVLGKLPNPFIMENGDKVDTPEKWQERRKEIYKTAVELQYGTIPPKPEVLKVEKLYGGGYNDCSSYRIIAGTKEKQVDFLMRMFRPNSDKPCPVVVNGDLCFPYLFDKGYIDTFLNNKICFATFDRTMIAHDVQGEGRRKGQLYDVYPEYTFGAIGAWAWGFMRCVDALEIIGIDDLDLISFSGHSRGGKTAILAGAIDERAKIVAPNSTCACGCGCYRVHTTAIGENGITRKSETLADSIEHFPFWFSQELAAYADREQELPFDSHFLKAMVAPRILVVTESASDTWANPLGSWLTTMAAKEVFKFLGVEENVYWSFRKGYHYHKVADIEMLVNVISHVRDNAEISKRFFRLPFKKPEFIHDWHSPEKNF